MKSTKKDRVKFIMEKAYIVISFNEDGSRGCHFGPSNPIACMRELTATLARGQRSLLFNVGFNYKEAVYGARSNDISQVDKDFYAKVSRFATASEPIY